MGNEQNIIEKYNRINYLKKQGKPCDEQLNSDELVVIKQYNHINYLKSKNKQYRQYKPEQHTLRLTKKENVQVKRIKKIKHQQHVIDYKTFLKQQHLKEKRLREARRATKEARQLERIENRQTRLSSYKTRIKKEKPSITEPPINRAIFILLCSIRHRSKRKNIPCNIDARYIETITPTHCPILGLELMRGQGKGPKPNTPSVDRIIPELGYVKGNVIVVSMLANQIKAIATPDQIITVGKFYKNLMKTYGNG